VRASAYARDGGRDGKSSKRNERPSRVGVGAVKHAGERAHARAELRTSSSPRVVAYFFPTMPPAATHPLPASPPSRPIDNNGGRFSADPLKRAVDSPWREIGRPRDCDAHPRLPRRVPRPSVRVPRRSARPLSGLSHETGAQRWYRLHVRFSRRSHFKGPSGVVVAADAADRLRVTWLRLLTITPSYYRPQPRDRQVYDPRNY